MPQTVAVALALVQRAQTWLVALRRSDTQQPNLWEFPGGKIMPHEAPAAAALRELREECAVEATVTQILRTITHTYADRTVQLTPVLCQWVRGAGEPLESVQCRWVTTAELQTLSMPAANVAVLAALAEAC